MTATKRAAKLYTKETCPKCKRRLVLPDGPIDAKIGVLSDHPGYEEIKVGKPLVGKTGNVARAEMARVGIPLWECRVTNLWMHEPHDACDVHWHATQAAMTLAKCEYVLIMGADATQYFIEQNVSDICSLKVKSKYLPNAKGIICIPNPAVVFHGVCGEVRLGLKKFKAMIK